ncbi:2-amino-4-hydroxy-6-hydroxymethyldihydropteridine diphosphokinase [Homoserinimonas sp. A447]
MTGAAVERAVIALGSNLGDREATIRAAVHDIDAVPGVRVVAASALVESGAVKPTGLDESAPRYLNAVILAEVTITPLELLGAVNAIEQRHGRVRETVWGDRTLDVDLIAVGTMREDSERLTLPHPRAWQRSFVLTPWAQVDPDAVLPEHGRVADLVAGLDDAVWEFPAAPLLAAGERTPS